MSEDSFTEVEHESYGGGLMRSVIGIPIGIVLTLIAICCIFWNEGRSAKRQAALNEGSGQVVSVSADNVTSSNNGKLVHLSGKAIAGSPVVDSNFQVSAKALKIRSTVEMYQWYESTETETRKKLGGGKETYTTYRYNTIWSERPIDSNTFRQSSQYRNPTSMPFQSKSTISTDSKLGAFDLPESLIDQLDNYQPMSLSGVSRPPNLNGASKAGDFFYLGQNPSQPNVGDMRVSFSLVPESEVTVVAVQSGSSLQPYKTKNGGEIELIEPGILSAEEMFQKAEALNNLITWILRAVGAVLMVVGIYMILSPLSATMDVIPLLGDIADTGIMIVSFLVGASVSLLVASVAWIVYRPILGIFMGLIAVGIGWGIRALSNRKAAAA